MRDDEGLLQVDTVSEADLRVIYLCKVVMMRMKVKDLGVPTYRRTRRRPCTVVKNREEASLFEMAHLKESLGEDRAQILRKPGWHQNPT